jgi:hypothetical protein
MVADLSFDLHIVQLIDNLVFALNELLDLSIFCLINFFDKLAFKFVNTLLELVEAVVDSLKVASKLSNDVFCVLGDSFSHVILDVLSHFREKKLDLRTLSLPDKLILHFDHGVYHLCNSLLFFKRLSCHNVVIFENLPYRIVNVCHRID